VTENIFKTEKIYSTDIFSIDIHDFANINPMHSEDDFLALKHSISLIGQQEAIILFKGKVVDGRNRLQALKELYNETEDVKYKLVKYKKLPTTLSLNELEEFIIAKETRRHKTPVQKAIQALNYYELKKSKNEPISMTHVGKKFGVSQGQISKILTMKKEVPNAIVQSLFGGNAIEIKKRKKDGTLYTIKSTSPHAITQYYKDLRTSMTANRESLIDALEMSFIQIESTRLLETLSTDGVSYLVDILSRSKDINKTSYNADEVKKLLGLEK